jgi:hypothetical protein
LDTWAARDILADRLGEDRIAADPESVDKIVDACAGLPLALAVSATRAQFGFPLAVLATEPGRRLQRFFKAPVWEASEHNPGARVTASDLRFRSLVLKRDPVFGPVVMFGLGGVYVEVLKDVILRLAPVDRDSASEMIRRIKGFPLLAGVRGKPAASMRPPMARS